MTKDKALKLALEALEMGLPLIEDFGSKEQFNIQHKAIAAIYEALSENEFKPDWDEKLALTEEVIRLSKRIEELEAQPEQEPVALFKWLPEGATHIGRISVRTAAGGALAMTTRAFKYDSAVLKVYVTDNDNEYPGWRDAKDCFFHLNFPVLPLYTTPPQRTWVGLTEQEQGAIMEDLNAYGTNLYQFARAIEAAHGIKENT